MIRLAKARKLRELLKMEMSKSKVCIFLVSFEFMFYMNWSTQVYFLNIDTYETYSFLFG